MGPRAYKNRTLPSLFGKAKGDMELATIVRLTKMKGELRRIEEEKGRQQQRLDAFWEHPPPIDTEDVAKLMQAIRTRIRALDERKRALIQELLVGMACRNRSGGNGGN